ncbi:MAG: cytochrome P450 [Nannocystaceae bacterium]
MASSETTTDGRGSGGLREAPDSGGLPFFGHFFAVKRDLVGGLDRLYRRLGPVFYGRALGTTVLSLVGADANEHVLRNRDGHFASGPGWTPYIGSVFPGAIMAMDGADHRAARRIMQVAFSKRALAGYLGPMAAAIDHRLAAWGRRGRSFAATVYPEYKSLTLDIAALAFMGIELGPAAQALHRAFTDMVAATLAIVRKPLPGTAMRRGVRGRERLHAELRGLLPRKRVGDGVDLFSRLAQAASDEGERFTDQQIVEHMSFLMMAAHDTSTSALTSMTYLLAVNPGWQERLRAAARAAGDDLEAALDDPLTEPLTWTMKEALRLYPPLASMPRYCVREHEFLGYRVPADTIVGIYPMHTHYLPELWTDPRRFDPERFADDRREDRQHPGAWVPFGGGVHTCIGQHFAGLQIRAVMLRLLRSYRWRVAPGYTMPFAAVPIAKPADGLPVTLERLD